LIFNTVPDSIDDNNKSESFNELDSDEFEDWDDDLPF
jgi:hypothetical protein